MYQVRRSIEMRRKRKDWYFSTFDDLSEQAVIRRLKKMDEDDDDNLLTVSRNCRPVLEHQLVMRDFLGLFSNEIRMNFRLGEHW